jgi:hypothetical protein
MDYADSVSKYGYPAAFSLVENDATTWDESGYVCESCGTTRTFMNEYWLVGEISTCPRCLKADYGQHEKPRVIHLQEDGYLVLVHFQNGEGFTIGPSYFLKEDGQTGNELPLFVSRAYAEMTKDLYLHLVTPL